MVKKEQINLQVAAEIYEEADVVVIGGGPAGTAAAISAARCGQKVILLEQSGQLGGMGTLANVSIYMSVGNVTGIYREMLEETTPEAVPGSHLISLHSRKDQYSPFAVRHYLNGKLHREKVKVFYHTVYVQPVMEGQRVRGVLARTREGLKAFMGGIVLDCSGDAAVARDAGVPMRYGREKDGLTQPMTLMFTMQNTGKPVVPYLPEDCEIYESVDDLPQGRHLYWEKNDDGTLLVNMTRVKGNGARIEDVNFAEREALRQVFSTAHYLQRNGFENYIIAHIPGQTGVRETGQIVGLYTLTEQDLLEARRFGDVVAQTNYEIDIHSPDGQRTTEERQLGSYDIPYRCMVPAGVQGLLVAGRSISATHVAMSSMRVQATCYALGQAAGIAAAVAKEEGTVHMADISIPRLHQLLAEQGVQFHGTVLSAGNNGQRVAPECSGKL
ncbi:FAD-dependent oxidoreductase [Paenibacillus sp. FSL R5-0912]|uniref:FAD-dependent oxidoreductase n=1 Tax=Paenibacillus sp. FSL R5-0912 TaxID=1536771 RepID=UPI0007C73A1D|nr:FAD-dependent oxidoreductase [Paenibacillus sp. FSL R5-0912]